MFDYCVGFAVVWVVVCIIDCFVGLGGSVVYFLLVGLFVLRFIVLCVSYGYIGVPVGCFAFWMLCLFYAILFDAFGIWCLLLFVCVWVDVIWRLWFLLLML